MKPAIGRFASTTLAGRPMVVPDDLTRPTLLLFAYRQWQQRDVDTWLSLVPADGSIGVLEVPVLGRRWLPGKQFINGGMAANMDATTRAQTMCVYTDVARFRHDVLGVSSTDVLAVLTNRDGEVLWHALGAAEASTASGLRAAITRVGRILQ